MESSTPKPTEPPPDISAELDEAPTAAAAATAEEELPEEHELDEVDAAPKCYCFMFCLSVLKMQYNLDEKISSTLLF